MSRLERFRGRPASEDIRARFGGASQTSLHWNAGPQTMSRWKYYPRRRTVTGEDVQSIREGLQGCPIGRFGNSQVRGRELVRGIQEGEATREADRGLGFLLRELPRWNLLHRYRIGPGYELRDE